MKITASQVKELRDRTGAGMMDCRKALVESEGNLDEAVEVLRKAGAAKAAKKAGRVAAEGLVDAEIMDDGTAVLVEVNCETDFVARNESFRCSSAPLRARSLQTARTTSPPRSTPSAPSWWRPSVRTSKSGAPSASTRAARTLRTFTPATESP